MYSNVSSNTLEQLKLPEKIAAVLNHRQNAKRGVLSDEEQLLIGAPGYQPPHPHVLYDAIVALSLGKNVLLKGPTGSGKTKFAEHLSYLFQQPLNSVNCSIDLDAESLLGFKTLSHHTGKAEIEFVPGPVIKAMKKGHFLYIDEINMAKPETLPILNGVLDYRRAITNPFTSEIIRAGEGFGVIAAINMGYVGTVPLNEALKNRFVVIDVPYLQGEELKALLASQSLLIDEAVLDRFVQLSADLLAQAEMGQLSDEAVSIRALLDACDLAAYMPPLRAIQRAIVDKLEDDREKAGVLNLAETLF
jgi:nitric oxide reductase NorQ protein